MGHISGKDSYKQLRNKINELNVRVYESENLYLILKELYSAEEAKFVVNMPSSLSTMNDLLRSIKLPEKKLREILNSLCLKGLVVDIFINNNFYYVPSPMVIGIFEFTMMRMDKNFDVKKIAHLFHKYLDNRDFYDLNFGKNEKMGIMRSLPYEDSIFEDEYVEVLDYEKATAIVENADVFSIGHCSCRHEKLHVDKKKCDVPLETCSSFGYSAEYLIRNKLARKASKSEMLENIARSKEMGLILNSDNIRKKNQFICHCCKCCCNVIQGINKFGYTNILVTSSFIAELNENDCKHCGLCVKACGVEAIKLEKNASGKIKVTIDETRCLGCGVCTFKCTPNAIKLKKRKKKVIHPETTFENAILKHLERGNLIDQIFPSPDRIDQKFIKSILGGFLKLPPVKKALMSNMLRSSFLKVFENGAKLQGKEWLTKL